VLTLRRFIEHPRLEQMTQGPVWAFKILEHPATPGRVPAEWTVLMPSRHYELERCRRTNTQVASAPDASGGKYLVLSDAHAAVVTRPTYVSPTPELRWMFRARGHGALEAQVRVNGETVRKRTVEVDSEAWTWKEMPVEDLTGNTPISLRLVPLEEAVHADTALLAAGPWRDVLPGESLTLPAPCFFHAGYWSPSQDGVVLRAAYDPRGQVTFDGPRLPVPAGTYELDFVFSTAAGEGTELGKLAVHATPPPARELVVRAGEPARLSFTHQQNLPLRMEFLFARTADVTVRKVVIKRVQ
jgi:hypothetical protein